MDFEVSEDDPIITLELVPLSPEALASALAPPGHSGAIPAAAWADAPVRYHTRVAPGIIGSIPRVELASGDSAPDHGVRPEVGAKASE